ncbi:hypothetical protein MKZ38_008483 [Zalerion maritima]|uniref:Uncharacterized protein n=1 Tax=Zalerion maritima TaxID=339359 RepID=A0AAD5WVK3_9PEZI|nr:hypothetical protein MKZ38_008483 [Zalerion maritima]
MPPVLLDYTTTHNLTLEISERMYPILCTPLPPLEWSLDISRLQDLPPLNMAPNTNLHAKMIRAIPENKFMK